MHTIYIELNNPSDYRLITGFISKLQGNNVASVFTIIQRHKFPLHWKLDGVAILDVSEQVSPHTGSVITMEEAIPSDTEGSITIIPARNYLEDVPAIGKSTCNNHVKTYKDYKTLQKDKNKQYPEDATIYHIDVTRNYHENLSKKKKVSAHIHATSDIRLHDGYSGSLHFGELTTRFLQGYNEIRKNATIHILLAGDSQSQFDAAVRVANSILTHSLRDYKFYYVYHGDIPKQDSSLFTLIPIGESLANLDGKGFSPAVFVKNYAVNYVYEPIVITLDTDFMAQGDVSPLFDTHPSDYKTPFAIIYLKNWHGVNYRVKHGVQPEVGAPNGGLIIHDTNYERELFGDNLEKLNGVWDSIKSFSQYPDEDLVCYSSKYLNYNFGHLPVEYGYVHGHLGNALFIHFIHVTKPWKEWKAYTLKEPNSHQSGRGMPFEQRSTSLMEYASYYQEVKSRVIRAAGSKEFPCKVNGTYMMYDVSDILISTRKNGFQVKVTSDKWNKDLYKDNYFVQVEVTKPIDLEPYLEYAGRTHFILGKGIDLNPFHKQGLNYHVD